MPTVPDLLARRFPASVRGLVPGLAFVGTLALAADAGSHLSSSLSPLVLAVGFGVAARNLGLVPSAAVPGARWAARYLLRLGIILLGFRLSVGDVADLGASHLLVVLVVVLATFLGTQVLGRWLGVGRDLSLLIATGFSICGASAIAAMEGVTEADDEEVAFAIGLVTLYGSVAILLLPRLAGPLGLSPETFGAWVGASVHDVAQVVATASTKGPDALSAAIVVKLSRVVLLAPMVAATSLARRRAADGPADTAGPRLVPLFVVAFAAAVVVRSTGFLSAGAIHDLRTFETATLAAALAGLGTGVHLARLRRIGVRPLVLGLASWALVAGMSYVGVRWAG